MGLVWYTLAFMETYSPTKPKMSAMAAVTILLLLVTLLICLFPKPENDLFFELRIGGEILRQGRVPHHDVYSWTRSGVRWDVPEWLSFVCFAWAYQAGGFFGTWALMAVLTAAGAAAVWFPLARRLGLPWAFLLVNLMLLAMSFSIQERPYICTYMLLPVALGLLRRGREGHFKTLLLLPPLCALWANLHQGVVAFLGLLLLYVLGDAVTSRPQARRMLAIFAACAAASLVSPYGWGLYRNVFVTLHNHTLMANIIEWRPITSVPVAEIEPFVLLALLLLAALWFSRLPRLSDALVVAALFAEALLHVRNVALFAIGALPIATPHLQSAFGGLRERLHLPPVHLPPASRAAGCLLGFFAVFYVLTVGLVAVASLKRVGGTRGETLAALGADVARVSTFPQSACSYMQAQRFPPHLRLYNDLGIGGYIMWRLPQDPVFVDGRLDVYAGQKFDNALTLARSPGSPEWQALVRQYHFDCVLTSSRQEARAFAALPGWQLVYSDPPDRSLPRYRVLLCRPIIAKFIVHRVGSDARAGTKRPDP